MTGMNGSISWAIPAQVGVLSHGKKRILRQMMDMNNDFFEKPILNSNSPYKYPLRHWELAADGQPTQQIIDTRRPTEFITPIPKPKKRKASEKQSSMIFDEGKGLSTQEQQSVVSDRFEGDRAEIQRCHGVHEHSRC